ncbi:hypothetical protein CHARACLAT_018035 [Characodon lateralis]|uniref:Uncharacterized protein n=1 Tax=Characodon lateralis TaxID=208331 RepID=A0ABU7EVL6_9TELE|nr:hypothetical protein [Characodon lateralis]
MQQICGLWNKQDRPVFAGHLCNIVTLHASKCVCVWVVYIHASVCVCGTNSKMTADHCERCACSSSLFWRSSAGSTVALVMKASVTYHIMSMSTYCCIDTSDSLCCFV